MVMEGFLLARLLPTKHWFIVPKSASLEVKFWERHSKVSAFRWETTLRFTSPSDCVCRFCGKTVGEVDGGPALKEGFTLKSGLCRDSTVPVSALELLTQRVYCWPGAPTGLTHEQRTGLLWLVASLVLIALSIPML